MDRFTHKFIAVLVILLSIGCGTNMNANNMFDWKATESAPSDYPMQIIEGTFFYHGEPNDAGLYVPSGGVIHKGWGEMVSSHIVGEDLKPLPDELDITFFSYAENQFYHGSFDLPYDRILSLFKGGSEGKNESIYSRIMVGVAPGGAVAVWLRGRGITTEVFFGYAQPTEGELTGFGAVIPNRAEYVRAELEESVDADVLAAILKHGIPFNKWEKFRIYYQWKPVFMGDASPKDSEFKYLNGESSRLLLPLDEETAAASRPVPKLVRFTYRSPLGWAYLYIIHFDEAEMMEAFAQLGSNQEPLKLEFFPDKPIGQTQIRLSNKTESIVLRKYIIEDI